MTTLIWKPSQALRKLKEEPPKRDDFAVAKTTIYKLMEADTMPRFRTHCEENRLATLVDSVTELTSV